MGQSLKNIIMKISNEMLQKLIKSSPKVKTRQRLEEKIKSNPSKCGVVKTRQRLEEELQISIVKYYKLIAPTLPLKTKLYSNRNENNQGGLKGYITGNLYKAMGREAGVCDLSLMIEGGKKVYIELKVDHRCRTKTGKKIDKQGLSPEQEKFIEDAEYMGFSCYVICNIEQFQKLIKNLIIKN
jgi:hypothetical protein